MKSDLYLADDPIGSANDDTLNRASFAHRVADTIAGRSGTVGLVVGLYARWGAGKTSVLNLMAEHLEKAHRDSVVVRFNPWHFSSVEQLIVGFFETVAATLDAEGDLTTRKEKLGKKLRKYGSLVAVASSRAAAVEKLGKNLSEVTLHQLRDRVGEILKKAKKRPVIFVDDLDRLDSSDIRTVFKLVRLTGQFPNTTYVLAFDDDYVADALGRDFGVDRRHAGRDYLGKIIGVPLQLPAPDPLQLRKYVLAGLQSVIDEAGIELAEEHGHTFGQQFVGGLEGRLRTPRDAKRYINAAAFALPLLKGEVDPVDQLLVEGLRVFYPRLYASIRKNPDVYLARRRNLLLPLHEGDKERVKKHIEAVFDEYQEGDREAARELLLFLFPQLHGVFSRHSLGGSYWDNAARRRRVCVPDFFDRYFQYSVPIRDVSQAELRKMEELAATSPEEAAALFVEAAQRDGGERIVRYLRLHSKDKEPSAASRLARVVARSGAVFGEDSGVFLLSPVEQACALVHDLIARTELPTRGQEAQAVVDEAEPLAFAVRCFMFMKKDPDEATGLLAEQAEADLGKRLADRIKREVEAGSSPGLLKSRVLPRVLWVWNEYGNSDALRAHLETELRDPENAKDFLRSFVSRVIESAARERPGDFEDLSYDIISKYASTSTLYTVFETFDGKELHGTEYPRDSCMPPDERLARQFVAIHEKRLTESENSGAAEGE